MSSAAPITMNDLAPLESELPANWPPVWREIATSLFSGMLRSDALAASGVAPEAMAELSVELTVGLANAIGGDTVYIPVGHFLKASKTVQIVIATFRGENHMQCAKAANITVSRVRQILAEHQRAQFELRQAKLPL